MSNSNASRGKGEVRSITFEPLKGGVMSRTETRFKRGGQGGGPSFDHETESELHPTAEHAAAKLQSVMGHCFPKQPAPAEAEGKE